MNYTAIYITKSIFITRIIRVAKIAKIVCNASNHNIHPRLPPSVQSHNNLYHQKHLHHQDRLYHKDCPRRQNRQNRLQRLLLCPDFLTNPNICLSTTLLTLPSPSYSTTTCNQEIHHPVSVTRQSISPEASASPRLAALPPALSAPSDESQHPPLDHTVNAAFISNATGLCNGMTSSGSLWPLVDIH